MDGMTCAYSQDSDVAIFDLYLIRSGLWQMHGTHQPFTFPFSRQREAMKRAEHLTSSLRFNVVRQHAIATVRLALPFAGRAKEWTPTCPQLARGENHSDHTQFHQTIDRGSRTEGVRVTASNLIFWLQLFMFYLDLQSWLMALFFNFDLFLS